MRRIPCLLLLATIVVALVSVMPLVASAKEDTVNLMVVEWSQNGKVVVQAIPPKDDSMTNPHYVLLDFHWYTTINYWVNPSNKMRLATSGVVTAVTTSVDTWDKETAAAVFSYQGTIKKTAGRYDGYNVVSFGRYQAGVIAVTYIWYIGSQMVETDCRMNTYYQWSLTGQAGKMDVQNIMTHELGHWVGLDDLYSDVDYWLTMYGYADFGETYKRTLGLGDINGLEAWYGP